MSRLEVCENLAQDEWIDIHKSQDSYTEAAQCLTLFCMNQKGYSYKEALQETEASESAVTFYTLHKQKVNNRTT